MPALTWNPDEPACPGCSGSIALDNRTTCFQLDERILVDAGTGVGDLTLEEMAGIDHILLSHSHLDHVLGIPLLADSVMQHRLSRPDFRPIQVHGLPETLEALRAHLFNNIIWRTSYPTAQPRAPDHRAGAFQIGECLELADWDDRGAAGASHRAGLRLRGRHALGLVDLHRRHRPELRRFGAAARPRDRADW